MNTTHCNIWHMVIIMLAQVYYRGAFASPFHQE